MGEEEEEMHEREEKRREEDEEEEELCNHPSINADSNVRTSKVSHTHSFYTQSSSSHDVIRMQGESQTSASPPLPLHSQLTRYCGSPPHTHPHTAPHHHSIQGRQAVKVGNVFVNHGGREGEGRVETEEEREQQWQARKRKRKKEEEERETAVGKETKRGRERASESPAH